MYLDQTDVLCLIVSIFLIDFQLSQWHYLIAKHVYTRRSAIFFQQDTFGQVEAYSCKRFSVKAKRQIQLSFTFCNLNYFVQRARVRFAFIIADLLHLESKVHPPTRLQSHVWKFSYSAQVVGS